MTATPTNDKTPAAGGPRRFDYKEVEALQRFLSPQARIHSAKRTGLSAREQRQLKRAIKYARFLALLPFTT